MSNIPWFLLPTHFLHPVMGKVENSAQGVFQMVRLYWLPVLNSAVALMEERNHKLVQSLFFLVQCNVRLYWFPEWDVIFFLYYSLRPFLLLSLVCLVAWHQQNYCRFCLKIITWLYITLTLLMQLWCLHNSHLRFLAWNQHLIMSTCRFK